MEKRRELSGDSSLTQAAGPATKRGRERRAARGRLAGFVVSESTVPTGRTWDLAELTILEIAAKILVYFCADSDGREDLCNAGH